MILEILKLVIVGIFSAGFFGFIQFLIARSDKKKEKEKEKQDHTKDILDDILSKLQSIERDGKRTQLLMLIKDYPDRDTEIMEVAEKYFNILHGNWYAHEIFEEWLSSNSISKPEWFK